MIAVDWGTSSLRAFRLSATGAIVDRREMAAGIMHVEDGRFADTLAGAVGPWLAAGETRILMCGMIGSRQGWREAPYLPCPAGVADLAGALTRVPFDDATVLIVPGLAAEDRDRIPEVMRGEETQIAGALAAIGARGIACLPGTHSKWARIEDEKIAGFSTHMTGEVFEALRTHTILGRLMSGDGFDERAFDHGVARARDQGGLLHHLFGTRTLGLGGRIAEAAASSYLSGLLIGHEIKAALAEAAPVGRVHLIGSDKLCRLYARALEAHGAAPTIEDQDAAVAGLARIGELTH